MLVKQVRLLPCQFFHMGFICFVLFCFEFPICCRLIVLQKTIKMSQQSQIAIKVSKHLLSISVLVSLCTSHGV